MASPAERLRVARRPGPDRYPRPFGRLQCLLATTQVGKNISPGWKGTRPGTAGRRRAARRQVQIDHHGLLGQPSHASSRRPSVGERIRQVGKGHGQVRPKGVGPRGGQALLISTAFGWPPPTLPRDDPGWRDDSPGWKRTWPGSAEGVGLRGGQVPIDIHGLLGRLQCLLARRPRSERQTASCL
jgi:hypothetical protein